MVPAAVAIVAVGLLTAAAAAENSDVAASLKTLARVRWTWFAVGVALEVISIAAFATMFRRLLKAGRVTPRRSEMLVTVYAANAMSVSVPLAGPGLAAAYLFRRFARSGAGTVGAGWTLLAGGVISTTAWVVVLTVGGLASGDTVALAITAPALAFAVAVAATIAVAARYPRVRQVLENLLTQALTHGARLLRWPTTDPKLALRAWVQRLGALRLPTSDWVLALGDSLLNWLTDAAVLTVAIIAVGARVPWHDLLLVYAAGVSAQGLSLTPGGLAITEGAISLALVASGMHVREAVAAAVLYRLISFWFNAALGWLVLLFLQARRPAAQPAPEPALEPSAEPVPQTAPHAHELVLLHGQPGSAADWDAVLARLPAHLHAVAKDRPGYGASQRNAAGFIVNAQVVLDDLDERGVDAAVLVAHSWAGGAALLAARLAPHRVKAVVLLAGVGPGSVSIVDWLLAAPVIGPLAAQVMWLWTPWIARVRLAWLRGREGRPLDPGEHLSLQVWGEKHAGAKPRWRAFLTEQRALLSELAELEGALPSVGVPVLLLADPADQIVPIMTAQRLVSELPHARLRLISDAGHHLPRRAPGAVAEAIAGFVATLDETGTQQPGWSLGCTLCPGPCRFWVCYCGHVRGMGIGRHPAREVYGAADVHHARAGQRLGGILMALTVAAAGCSAVSSSSSGRVNRSARPFAADLERLAAPIEACIMRDDTANPAFHGCVDWHSAVHATFSLLAISRITGDLAYRSAARKAVGGRSAIEMAVTEVQASRLTEELPYGYGWSLILDTEARIEGNTQFDGLAGVTAATLATWLTSMAPGELARGALSQEYENTIWPVVCLLIWSRVTRHARYTALALHLAGYLLAQAEQRRVCSSDGGGTYGFFAPCSLLAVTAWLAGRNAGTIRPILVALATYQPVPENDMAAVHSAGLNFSRSWGDMAVYNLTGSTQWLGRFTRLFDYEMRLNDIWAGSYYLYAHWVAQFGVFGVWLRNLRLAS